MDSDVSMIKIIVLSRVSVACFIYIYSHREKEKSH
jgi:hypothetical protein